MDLDENLHMLRCEISKKHFLTPKKVPKNLKKEKKIFNPHFWHVKDCSYQFSSKSIKVDLQSRFFGSKKAVVFLVPQKAYKKSKIAKKGLVAPFGQQFTICMPNYRYVRLLVSAREGGVLIIEGLSS